uniref:Uncharacterized protein n=1 Tax=Candidatus Nitrotoga fabula TaxID=2182327 RepID=A0A2X0QTA5_9PROT|nr:protein of unknown function [Candidatus Nitrotoga fabula]
MPAFWSHAIRQKTIHVADHGAFLNGLEMLCFENVYVFCDGANCFGCKIFFRVFWEVMQLNERQEAILHGYTN